MLLHNSQEFKDDLGRGSEEDLRELYFSGIEYLFLSLSFGIHNASQAVSKNVDSRYFRSERTLMPLISQFMNQSR